MNPAHESQEPNSKSVSGESFALLQGYLCYLDYLGKGEPPPQDDNEQDVAPTSQVEDAGTDPCYLPCYLPPPEPAAEPSRPEPLRLLSALAPELPDPTRPYWWFSSERVAARKLSAGCAMREEPGTRLPMDADYWCHDGAEAWVAVDRTNRPRPIPPKPKKKLKPRLIH